MYVLLAVLLYLLQGCALVASQHTNNWAVLVDTSRFWFNYRHYANTLSVYRTIKRLGIPDDQVILMLADDMACNPRNKYPSQVYNNPNKDKNIYGENIEVDYRGYDVNVLNFIRLLTGRLEESTPDSKRLLTDENSNILVFLTGHGGDGFIKFQDAEELTDAELADAFEQMRQKRRYNEILFIVDTCQANTLFEKVYSPNILSLGSAMRGENSFSTNTDPDIGVSMIDRMPNAILEVLETEDATSTMSIEYLFKQLTRAKLQSQIGVDSSRFERPLSQVKVTDFFGQVSKVLKTTDDENNIIRNSEKKTLKYQLKFQFDNDDSHQRKIRNISIKNFNK